MVLFDLKHNNFRLTQKNDGTKIRTVNTLRDQSNLMALKLIFIAIK